MFYTCMWKLALPTVACILLSYIQQTWVLMNGYNFKQTLLMLCCQFVLHNNWACQLSSQPISKHFIYTRSGDINCLASQFTRTSYNQRVLWRCQLSVQPITSTSQLQLYIPEYPGHVSCLASQFTSTSIAVALYGVTNT